ncbi:MAG: hypothetical protein PHI31_12700 [Desulfuromonadaceae bacterium]|nr:hypothetical protein [Desulfuromonadaceae bacterium]
MARTSAETATILSELYNETFARDSYEKFRITWSQLRLLSGTPKLTDNYLLAVNQVLGESGYTLVPLDDFLIMAQHTDFSDLRAVPDRIIERYLPDEDDDLELDDDDDVEIEGPDDDES